MALPSHDAAGRRRFKYFLLNIVVLMLIGAIVAGRPLLSGHVVRLLEYVAAIVALGTGQAIVASLASRPPRPRPRWYYLLLSVGLIIAAVVLGLTAGWAVGHHNGLSVVLAGAAIFASVGALIEAARGSLRGRLRRAMWRYPPPWLDVVEPSEAESGGSGK
jgi:hypothetical protein